MFSEGDAKCARNEFLQIGPQKMPQVSCTKGICFAENRSSMLDMNEISWLHEMCKVSGLHLPARHDLLDGGEFENHS